MKSKGFWDVVVVREDGRWVGFRAPWASLRRVSGLLSLLFLLSAILGLGWVLARWRVYQLDLREGRQRLELEALRYRLKEFEGQGSSDKSSTQGGAGSSFLPALGSEDFGSPGLNVSDVSARVDPQSQELALKFQLKRDPAQKEVRRLRWLALLHGAQGLMVFPPALSSRKGELLLPELGESIDEIRDQGTIAANYKAKGFAELAASAPLYVTLLIYDERGSLLLRQRHDLRGKETTSQ